ncbi:MAG TPA: glycoside hydrolase family 15 protein [Pyrinomonadaceae bacterium]|jgi:oligosaccharide amylase|nr:glycoside hydrolase family 15 protein [Pyrinomonadaceae bacterium]
MRDIPVGNGSLLVNFDDRYNIRDIYFPHVGQENHTEGYPCRFGIWANGEFSWVSDDDWQRRCGYVKDSLVTDVELRNERLGVKLECSETVASHENVFLRRVKLTNLSDSHREFRVFLHHDLRIYENKFGDTAFFDPDTASLIHYKKHRYFLIGTEPRFSTYSTGRKAFKEEEGTWRDAEDGNLKGKVITEGSVDSTIGVYCGIDGHGEYEFFYWLAAGTSYDEVAELYQLVKQRTPQRYLAYTANYWKAWVNKNDHQLERLPEKVVDLFKRSLLIVHSQIDTEGAILAANDHDVAERATDHYSYLWTRDGAFVANALDKAGYSYITRKFFDLCRKIVHKDGYFLQKYNPDGSLASGWHACWDPWRNERLIPIQEDETALVLWALWEHYQLYRDIEFTNRLYRRLVVSCAEFMTSFRDPDTGLPKPSWNLWEDRRGVHTFTCSTVVAGLRAAANFAEVFAEFERVERYRKAADEIVAAMRKHLYSQTEGRFLRSLLSDYEGDSRPDAMIDASLFGTFYFGCFDVNDEMVANTMQAISERLATGGGTARFEEDGYMRGLGPDTGNAWFICTLWLAEYYIAKAASCEELSPALALIEWVAERALPSGVLSEQFDTDSGRQVSVSPLTWSHSTFVSTVLSYRAKAQELS